MKRYNPSEIEPKWQKIWADNKTYQAPNKSDKPKAYIAAMFPYPSGAGLHTGHARNYSIVDAIARFYRQRGRNVMNPIGWDTFGLPAENYAIKTGTAPAEITVKNIETFKNQLNRLGMSFDWSREVNTSDPEYYKWTQWIFTQLFERGLAYQKESYQWWDPIDKTVLANEQVVGGISERSGAKVEKRNELSQKTAIIDEKILWYGSVNFLGAPNFHTPNPQENEECTIRIFSAAVAQEIEAEMVGKEEES